VKLYMTGRSGNSYKARLLLALLGVPYEKVLVDLHGGEHKRPAFLALNPRGQVPVLEDGGEYFWDSTAVLVYIARKHGGEKWLPTDPSGMGRVMQWMALAQNEINYGLKAARVMLTYDRPGHLAEFQAHGREGLAVLEGRLSRNDWLAADRPTIADLACYPYTATAPEGGVPIDDYPSINAWIARIEALPGWIEGYRAHSAR
jgi:glutathione S-transferase